MVEQATVRQHNAPAPKKRDVVSEGFTAHTKGEKLFNDITYTGLGYFGVTTFSVFMTWLFRDTKFFGPKFAKAAEDISKAISKTGQPTADTIESTQSWLRVGALFTGGSLMTVTGVKALEDNKAKIVKHFDKQIYGEEAVQNDPEIIAAHRLIESQPKQTWSSVGWSRVVAFGATLASLFTIGGNSGIIAKHLGTSFDTLGLQFGRWGGRLANKLKGNTDVVKGINEAIAENKLVHDNFRTVVKGKDTQLVKTLSDFGADGLYTVITAVGLFVFTRILAPIFDKDGAQRVEDTQEEIPQRPSLRQSMGRPVDPQRSGDDDAARPRVRVEHVASAERLADAANLQLGAPN